MFVNYRRKKNGFTLLEMLVAIGVFSVVATVAVSSVLMSLRANRKIRSTQTVINNLGYALESMTRAIRVGTHYHCDVNVGPITARRDCSSAASSFAFESSGGDRGDPNDQVVYRLNGTTIERSLDGGASYSPFTAAEVVVERLQFFVEHAAALPDQNQPFVIMTIEGYAAPDPATRTDFHIQTTVTQRIRDQIP